jgi:LysM repeat protein
VSYPGDGRIEGSAVVSFNSPASDAQRFNPTRPDSAAASVLQTGAVGGVTPAKTYKVASNDSLWKVAKKHGISIGELAAANNLRPDTPLKVGQKLIIPGKLPSAASGNAAGVIRALRHAHLSPTDADFYGVKHGDMRKLKIGGDCGITLDKMLARVDKSFKLEVHIDTDEGNACNLQPETPCELTR